MFTHVMDNNDLSVMIKHCSYEKKLSTEHVSLISIEREHIPKHHFLMFGIKLTT